MSLSKFDKICISNDDDDCYDDDNDGHINKKYLQIYGSSLRVPQITWVKFSHLLVVSENCSGYGHSATFKGKGLTSFFSGLQYN